MSYLIFIDNRKGVIEIILHTQILADLIVAKMVGNSITFGGNSFAYVQLDVGF